MYHAGSIRNCSLSVSTFATPFIFDEDYIVLTEEYVHSNLYGVQAEQDGIDPCRLGVITKCQACNTYTVDMVCQGVYYETLTAATTCSSHTNCQIRTEMYWVGGRCTQCDQYYVLAHNEYKVHYLNGAEIYRVRCCYYYQN